LVGYCNDDPFPFGVMKPFDSLARIPEACAEHDVDIVVVEGEFLANPVVTNGCLMAARLGCEVHGEESFLEGFLERVDPDSFDRGAILLASFANKQPFALLLKRLLDIAAASLALILTSWLMLLIYLVSRVASSAEPVFYRQERCGLFGKPFRIIKFRTMRADAEKDGPVWAVRDDPRTTRLGKFLRRTHLDELPQFWNILKGDMSFVGPRPERPEMARILEKSVPSYSFRHWVRPGLTGLAQIRFRYSNTIEDARTKLQYDLYYLKNWSLVQDVLIVLRTIAILVRGSW
jgi:exopolysaccharide biosynthesis polyprenyl glycosylphosphotransferase